MKPRFLTVFASLLGFLCANIPAQGQEVYVTPGKNGPVFSDKPQADSREVKLQPLTVIPAPPRNASADEAATGPDGLDARREERDSREAAAPYRKLEIVAPADGASVAGDTSFLEVRLAVDPPLRLADGHAFIAYIDGRSVDRRFTTTDFVIPPDFWPEGYLPANRGVQLDVAVIDGNDQVVMRAPAAHFRSRQVVFLPQPYAPPPWGHPLPPPLRPGMHPPPHPGARPPARPGMRPPMRPGARPAGRPSMRPPPKNRESILAR